MPAPFEGQAAFDAVMSLLRGRGAGPASRLAAAADGGAAFLGFLERHALSGFVDTLIGQSPPEATLPAPVRAALRAAYLRQWSQSEALLGRMAELKGLFESAGVDHLFLKGPLFAQRYCGNIDRRLTGDVDVLIRPRAVDAVEALLRGAGFAPRSRPFVSRRLAMRFTHHFEYERETTVVEVHWELANHFTYRIDEEAVWAGRAWTEYRGRRYPVPSTEYDLVMQLLTIFKDTELGTIAARSFVDLYAILLSPHEIDWEVFFAARDRQGLLGLSLNMLDLGLEVLGAREEFPTLAAALEQQASLLIGRDRPYKGLEIFAAAPPALGNKRRLFRLYDTSLAAACGWWILSLPWRVTAYRRHA